MNPELDDLLAQLLNLGHLPAAGRSRLAAILRADPAARRHYLDHVQMHALLAHEHGLLAAMVPDAEPFVPRAAQQAELVPPSPVLAHPARNRPLALPAAAAAFVVSGLFLGTVVVMRDGGGDQPNAQAARGALVPGPVPAAPAAALPPDSRLPPPMFGAAFDPSPGAQNRPPARTVSTMEKVSFSRDVRPVLSDHCFQCHGPDAAARKAKLRLDQEEDLFSGAHDPPLITRFRPDESELFYRVSTSDEDDVMPPPEAHKPLDAAKVDVIRRWIEEGATWQEHWAFVAPHQEDLPAVSDPGWIRGSIDQFVLAELDRKGLAPSPEADASTLARRLFLDLTGLPPTPADVARFLAAWESDPQSAMEDETDRLLASSDYGEHRARYWLDAARYGDTHGLHLDNYREIWPYRDWVVDAFNANMPFDQFTVEQLAGDLLPEPTLSQQVATGFNRCNVTTSEGGAIAEEFAVRYAIDRVETTSAVWLGLTTGCAACHDHKFDPVSQKEFYQLFAYFNNTTQSPMDGNVNDTAPVVDFLPPAQHAEREHLLAEERALAEALQPHAAPGPATLDPAAPGQVPPPADTIDQATFDPSAPFSIALWTGGEKTLLSKTEKVGPEYQRGLVVQFVDGRLRVEFLHYGRNNNMVLVSEAPLPAARTHHIVLTSTGAVRPGALRAFANGLPIGLRAEKNALFGTVANGGAVEAPDGTRFYPRPLAPSEALALSLADLPPAADLFANGPPDPILLAAARRAPLLADPALADFDRAFLRRSELEGQSAVTHVMAERLDSAPVAHILERGEYDQRREEVRPGIPSVLPQPPEDAPQDRLGLARWVVDPQNPLTARVTVNRLWQQVFGHGLVRTPDDFGLQGEPPTHPELLDYLAVDFVDSGWDVKRFLRQLVLSATYRQSSRTTPELVQADPKNRLLARSPRFRLDAEVLRDQALAASGLLDATMGGPGVRPYQPPGIWEAVGYSGSNTVSYVQDHGSALYRRSLYSFWKRTAPPPSMTLFDAPDRESCSVRRERTNTPLQALVLMNDPQYVEAARALAQRALLESPDAAVAAMHQFVLAKPPRPADAQVFEDSLATFLARFRDNPDAARALIATGESIPSPDLDAPTLAAHTLVASQILNLDESLNRN
ncbi:hypothetical protein BH23VER1_BH23VER1_33150 [soil metagenome]